MSRHPQGSSWLWRNPRTAALLITTSLLVVVLVSVEWGLRSLGYSYTRKPDKLVIEDTFFINEQGLFVANPSSVKHSGLGINQEGFRSPDFDLSETDGKEKNAVMLIGDSFTWGATANPISQSFADLVRAQGYRVYNLGIPGMGPMQYRRLAETYIPRLRPDVVVVGFYLGNDFLDAQWEPPAGRPPYYVLESVGWITPFDEAGNYIDSVDEAYEHFHNKFGHTRRFLRETAIGTLMIKAYRAGMAWFYQRQRRVGKMETAWAASSGVERGMPDSDYVAELKKRYAPAYRALGDVQAIAEKYGARFYTMAIPALGSGCLSSRDFTLEVQQELLKDLHPFYPGLSSEHYTGIPDCHFNNEGHRITAEALLLLLSDLGTGEW